MSTTEYRVTGMTCGHCEMSVREEVEQIVGVENVDVSAVSGKLIVTGAQTDMCVRSTLHGALARGYDAMLVGDAHTTVDMTEHGAPPPEAVISHTNLYWSNQRAPGRMGGVIESRDVDFERLASGSNKTR